MKSAISSVFITLSRSCFWPKPSCLPTGPAFFRLQVKLDARLFWLSDDLLRRLPLRLCWLLLVCNSLSSSAIVEYESRSENRCVSPELKELVLCCSSFDASFGCGKSLCWRSSWLDHTFLLHSMCQALGSCPARAAGMVSSPSGLFAIEGDSCWKSACIADRLLVWLGPASQAWFMFTFVDYIGSVTVNTVPRITFSLMVRAYSYDSIMITFVNTWALKRCRLINTYLIGCHQGTVVVVWYLLHQTAVHLKEKGCKHSCRVWLF